MVVVGQALGQAQEQERGAAVEVVEDGSPLVALAAFAVEVVVVGSSCLDVEVVVVE